MEELINAFLHLLHDTELFVRRSSEQFGGEDLATFLHDYRCKRVNPLYRRMKRMEELRYVISMVGLTNVGKSTLAHALLGHPVAPRLNGPATAVPVEYEYAETWMLKKVSRGEQRILVQHFDSSEALTRVLETVVLGQDIPAERGEQVPERVLVYGPMEVLKEGAVLADTPGFGAAQGDGMSDTLEKSMVDYLKTHVHEVMFCVSGANSMVCRSEVQFFHAIQELISTVIVTKWDSDADVREKEITRYREKFANLFPCCGFMFVEAKWAIEGRDGQSIEDLQALIRGKATRQNRLVDLNAQLVNAWEDLQELGREPLRKSRALAMPWHKAALPRFLKQAKMESLLLTTIL